MRTYTITGKGPEVGVRFTEPLDLSGNPHEIGLVSLQTTNTVMNVKPCCNQLHYSDPTTEQESVITLPPGTYTLDDIHYYINIFLESEFRDEFSRGNHFFELGGEANRQICRINTSFILYFDRPNSIGQLLGYTRVVKPTTRDEYAYSDSNVTLVRDFNVFVTCNAIDSGFINNRKSHILYQFHINDAPASIVEERPGERVYHRVTRDWIDEIVIRMENAEGHLIPLRSDTEFTCTLILRTARDDI